MRKIHYSIIVTVFILICIGIVMIYSSSSIYANQIYNDGMFFLKKHLYFVFLGILLMLITMSFDYHLLKNYAKPIILLCFFLLILVLIPGIGRQIAGARRWFRWGNFSFQPSEFAYLAIVIYISDFISRKEIIIRNNFFRGFFIPILVMAGIAVLILAQPDLGSAFALAIVVLIMLFIAGARKKYILGILILSFIMGYFLILKSPYRKGRLSAFLNPWQDPKGIGFQIIQSNIALGSGGLFGKGLGHSLQKLFYLPAAHTDFVFSIIGEELGLIGTLGVCLLFINFFIQGFRVCRNTDDTFGKFLSLGIVLVITLKSIINMGVTSGVFPTKGLPLPFV
ncbi:MAG: putative lipid II flippase FtsW, partial [Candidatus Omnitrophica bacterium]|nr:putative lipid II flippase FtsW [Candidatus Omnitrophota bacterium]